jgi:hypothetical protein
MKHLRSMCATLALVVTFSTAGYSQAVSGTVLGTVTERDGRGRRQRQSHLDRSEHRNGSQHSNEWRRQLHVPIEPEGNYSLPVELAGFKNEVRQNIRLAVTRALAST